LERSLGKLNEEKKTDTGFLLKQDEQRTKENWFIFTIVCAIYPILADILFSSFFQRENPPLAFVILGNVIFLCLIYHFAYRKSGTRFLTFIIFMKLSGLIGMIQLIHATPFQGPKALNYCCTVIDFFLVIGWLSLSFRLRKTNLVAKYLRKNILVATGT
jgi:hypothetical protein